MHNELNAIESLRAEKTPLFRGFKEVITRVKELLLKVRNGKKDGLHL